MSERKCETCGGAGVCPVHLAYGPGFGFLFSGLAIKDRCPTCHGTGRAEAEPKETKDV